MFCRILKPYPDGFINKKAPFYNALINLYEKQIFVIKEIKKGMVFFYLSKTFKNSMKEIFMSNNEGYLSKKVDNFVPRIRKENVIILTFVDLWELKRNGNQDM